MPQGAKIRSTYIAFAHKEKQRLEALLIASTKEIAVREQEVARLKGFWFTSTVLCLL
jgi:protein kinase C substrate 80K-H